MLSKLSNYVVYKFSDLGTPNIKLYIIVTNNIMLYIISVVHYCIPFRQEQRAGQREQALQAVNIEERSWRILPSSHHRRSPITPWLIPKRRRSRSPNRRRNNRNNSSSNLSRNRLSQRPNKSRSLVSAATPSYFYLSRHRASQSTWRNFIRIL